MAKKETSLEPYAEPTVQAEKMNTAYTDDERWYSITKADGTVVFYPSVTTIIGGVRVDSFLDDWKLEQAEKIGVEGQRIALLLASERGKAVHNGIESYCKGVELQWFTPDGEKAYSDIEWKCLNRFDQWFHETKPRVLQTEEVIYSDVHRYAGQFDALVELDGKTYMCDWKTSKGVYGDYPMQIASYAAAYEELYHKEIHGCIILALRVPTVKGWQEVRMERGPRDSRNAAEASGWEAQFQKFLRRKAVFDDAHEGFEPKRDLLPVSLSSHE